MKEDKLNTLDYYKVIYRHVPVKAPTNEIEHLKLEGCALRLLNLCCCSVEGSRVFLKLPNVEARTTMLRNCFSSTEFENLPTNNIQSHRIFPVFDRKDGNQKFKAKTIRNDMTLYQLSFQSIPDGKFKAIIKVYNKRENERMKFLPGKLKRKPKRLTISH